jgi:hypothetical protein
VLEKQNYLLVSVQNTDEMFNMHVGLHVAATTWDLSTTRYNHILMCFLLCTCRGRTERGYPEVKRLCAQPGDTHMRPTQGMLELPSFHPNSTLLLHGRIAPMAFEPATYRLHGRCGRDGIDGVTDTLLQLGGYSL